MMAFALHRRRLLLSGAAATFAATAPARADERTIQVVIDKLTFMPAEISVKAGQTIEWINKDRVAHTATVKGSWEVMIPPGKTATKVAGREDGGEYYCRFHPNMKGRIVIVG